MTRLFARLLIPTIMLLPARALAQYRGAPAPVEPGHTRLAFAFVYGLRYTRVEERSLVTPDGHLRGRFESEYASGAGGSVLAEVLAAGALRGMAAVTVLDRQGGAVERRAGGEVAASVPGSTFVFATAGIAVRLAERSPGMQETRLHTAFRLGPTYAVELSRRAADGGERRTLATWGIGLAIEAEAPIGAGATFQVGVEDHVLYPDRAELARRLNEDFARAGVNTYATVTAPPSHVVLLRAGFAFTFD